MAIPSISGVVHVLKSLLFTSNIGNRAYTIICGMFVTILFFCLVCQSLNKKRMNGMPLKKRVLMFGRIQNR